MQAILVGAPLAHLLVACPISRVIARFDFALQLESDDGRWWAITTHANPGAYRAVMTALPDCDLRQRFEWSYQSFELWDPRPSRRTCTQVEKQSAARQLATQLNGKRFLETQGVWEIIASKWQAIARALRECDDQSLRELLTVLIGRGTGLTPTGDDFVQALLVTLQSGDEHDRAAFGASARAVVPLLQRTTRLSRGFLDEALHGWAFGPLKNLLEALPSVSNRQVESLLHVGATSGAASALGVLMGLSYEFD